MEIVELEIVGRIRFDMEDRVYVKSRLNVALQMCFPCYYLYQSMYEAASANLQAAVTFTCHYMASLVTLISAHHVEGVRCECNL